MQSLGFDGMSFRACMTFVRPGTQEHSPRVGVSLGAHKGSSNSRSSIRSSISSRGDEISNIGNRRMCSRCTCSSTLESKIGQQQFAERYGPVFSRE